MLYVLALSSLFSRMAELSYLYTQFPTREKDPYDTSDSWSTESSSSSAETGGAPPEELAEVYARVKDAIDDLGGCVIPKLQWSCPKDASWMMPNNTIQCSTADDVFLLLKSSDRIAHDVEVLQQICHQSSPRSPLVSSTTHNHGHDDDEQDDEEIVKIPERAHVLALRRWYDLKPGREFRCFVKNNRLIGMYTMLPFLLTKKKTRIRMKS